MLLTFFNDYLATDQPAGQGLGTHTATLIILVFGLGGGVGVVAGGFGGQALYNRKKEHLPILMFTAILCGMAPMYCEYCATKHVHYMYSTLQCITVHYSTFFKLYCCCTELCYTVLLGIVL